MRRLADRPLDVFIDLTASGGAAPAGAGGWPLEGRLTVGADRITCAVRPGTWTALAGNPGCEGWQIDATESAIDACSAAMARAASDQACLLLLQGPVEISDESLLMMRQALDADPLFGSAVARTACERGCCFRSLSQTDATRERWITRRVLPDTPAVETSPECAQAALLIAPEVVSEFGLLVDRFSTLTASVLHYLSRARRCGYRTVVVNRAVVTIAGARCDGTAPGPVVPDGDLALLRQLTPDLDRGWEEFRIAGSERFETLSAQAYRGAGGTRRPSLLLDIRNVVGVHNGTAQAVLGSVRSLRQLAPAWEVSILANPPAVEFHGLAGVCRGWDLHTSLPDQTFTAALRLSQPWHIQEMIDLHWSALFNAYYMLDTISWDVVYAAPKHLDGTWSFLADYADGYLFDSAFTERRFLARFGHAREKPRTVCHYPFAPAEYVRAASRVPSRPNGILVIGNELDHKDVTQTVELLSGAFPFQPLVCFGPPAASRPGVRVCRSGSLPDEDMHQLYADAGIIVLPSFYEGFGFPIVTGLAYGKTVIARRSDLLDEIARHCTTGRLIGFTRRDELVEIVGRLLHGEAVREEPLGAAVKGNPRVWIDVAIDIMRFLDSLVSQPGRSRWRQREHAVNQLLAYRA